VEVLNPFVGGAVAVRYAQARPALHHHVIEFMLARQPRARRAIDLACGTGLSTVPLVDVASSVVGVDASSAMLALAPRAEDVTYALAVAESLPFEDGAFDLATICSALHWFGRPALQELSRIVRAEGRLVVYDVWFPAVMVDEPRFAQWIAEVCRPRYPPVPKRHSNLPRLVDIGFQPTWSTQARFEVEMGLESIVAYLMTHSERVTAIEVGRETEAEQIDFLSEGLRPLFTPEAARSVVFGIWVEAFQLRTDRAMRQCG
jgi:SAM-dependent methyltransferase